jgi:hypothetical protein
MNKTLFHKQMRSNLWRLLLLLYSKDYYMNLYNESHSFPLFCTNQDSHWPPIFQ